MNAASLASPVRAHAAPEDATRPLAERAMVDLHCHLLPGIDDGAPDEQTALAMARMAVADGIGVSVCTPHIFPGLYDNDSASIRMHTAALQASLDAGGIALTLACGADAHLTPQLLGRLRSDTAPTLNGGRYFLLEPPHHVAPPRFEEVVFEFLVAGYVPVITHPERLTWIARHYDMLARLALRGAWLQVTAGSLTGRCGGSARYWGERLLDEGYVHLLATDAHGAHARPPLLAEGRRAAERWVGAAEAQRLVVERPHAVLENLAPGLVEPVRAASPACTQAPRSGWWDRLVGRRASHRAA